MAGLCCGLDIGSTNVKVLLADGDGRSLWVRSVPTPRRDDGIGICTDAAELAARLEEMIVEGWRAVGKGVPLAAIAATGVGEDGVAVDYTLRPLGLAVPWFDRRAEADAAALAGSAAAAAWPGIRFDSHATAGKWHWLRRNRPHDVANARCWIALTDYPASLWTGRPFISATLAARTACFDVAGRAWIDGLLAESGAPPLPPVLKAGEIVGTVADGALRAAGAASASTLVVAGGHDHPIAASAVRRIAAEARVDSIGTANVVYGEAPRLRQATAESGIDLSVPVRGGEGFALIGVTEFSAPLAAAFRAGELQALLAAAEIPGTPAASAPGAPASEAAAPGERLRHILEFNGWKARRFLAAMAAAGVPDGPLFATGGWARSRALVELRASLFGEAVTTLHEPELAALGAALFAAEAATGRKPDFAASQRLEVIEPRAAWAAAYRTW